MITLRKRPAGNGKVYLYLDYYPPLFNSKTGKTKRREYLHMFIYEKPKNYVEKEYNNDVLKVAEAIRCKKTVSIMKEKNGFFDDANDNKDFLEYFKEQAFKHNSGWLVGYNHFRIFVEGKCRFGDLDIRMCESFKEYLLRDAKVATSSIANHHPRPIKRNTEHMIIWMREAYASLCYWHRPLSVSLLFSSSFKTQSGKQFVHTAEPFLQIVGIKLSGGLAVCYC